MRGNRNESKVESESSNISPLSGRGSSSRSSSSAGSFSRTPRRNRVTRSSSILDDIIVHLELPDGGMVHHVFKNGHTVEYLKDFIQNEYRIEYRGLTLYNRDDEMMMDPLTLLDFAEYIENHEIFIRVEGELPDEGRK